MFTIKEMPRGGTLVENDGFLLQVGAYPETIKDTMTSERGVPDLYLLPDDLFDTGLGISISDLEFPVYFNFYLKKKKCRFICRRNQVKPILKMLKEAVFGPTVLFTGQEFPRGEETPGYPDLRKEMLSYKIDPALPGGRLRLKHIIEVHTFDGGNKVQVDGVTISAPAHNSYLFEACGEHCEYRFRPKDEVLLPCALPEACIPGECSYVPPLFGVTVIGSGHGFDPGADTSGFIVWIDGKGILVDPPVNSTAWLKHNRVNTRQIEDLILTHCHADHDSGTLQKILEEGRIRVHTTETIMHSFVTKYSSLIGLSRREFRSLFEFEPVTIGKATTLAGAEFLFRYTLHSIPTINFEVTFQGKSFFYSSDTLNDPSAIRSLHEKGILSEGRMNDLLKVPFDDSLVFHEAGVPPIHTPIAILAELPDLVKEHLYLVHVSEKTIPAGKGLKLALPGVVNTLAIDVPLPEASPAYRILDVMAHIDLFSSMTVKKALEFLEITHHSVHEPGEIIIKRNTPGDRFFMLQSGEVEVISENLPKSVVYGRYDYFGETALILGEPRNADIKALTRTELIYINANDFLHFIRGTGLAQIFKRLNANRLFGARWLFEKHRILDGLTPLQKNQLMCMMEIREIRKGASLFRKGEPVSSYFLIDTGTVQISRDGKEAPAGSGTLVGEFDRNLDAARYSSEAQALSDVRAYRIDAIDMKAFFKANPGTYVRLVKSAKI
ncbi:MAG: cyclic nucleotide-binding domain-containing protein [Candidatus Eremiobacteraeota bacterium]|nr:cyclic nucleotide-binding domain-containing protein [Candidatus Eremiobacteraeota bacterium]